MGNWRVKSNSDAPIIAPMTEGIPNLRTILKSICLYNNVNLKILLKKCTMAVMAIAISIGKNTTNTGVSRVLKPKPETNVSRDATSATNMMIIVAMKNVATLFV